MNNRAGPPHSDVRKGLVITTLGGLLFTLDLPLLRLALADKWTLVFARGICLFIAISVVWYLIRHFSRERIAYIAGGAGIAVAATNTLANITYIGAIVETSAANVVFITALIPVITAVLSRLFIHERVHPFTWLATAISFFGVSIIVYDGVQGGTVLGDILALISATCTAAAFTIIRGSGKNVATSLAVGSLSSALIALVFFGVDGTALVLGASFGVPAWVWIALNGLIAIPLASTLIANGPRFLPSADVSMFFLLETVLTPVWIWVLFSELPSKSVFLGGLIVVTTLIAHSVWRLYSTLNGDGQKEAPNYY
jgi:drug/metabolite transporter (DMT)-like permease